MAKGRATTASAARSAKRVERLERSGLSIRTFAVRAGLEAGLLSFWKWKLARQGSGAKRPGARVAPRGALGEGGTEAGSAVGKGSRCCSPRIVRVASRRRDQRGLPARHPMERRSLVPRRNGDRRGKKSKARRAPRSGLSGRLLRVHPGDRAVVERDALMRQVGSRSLGLGGAGPRDGTQLIIADPLGSSIAMRLRWPSARISHGLLPISGGTWR